MRMREQRMWQRSEWSVIWIHELQDLLAEGGYHGRYIVVDLTTKSWKVEQLPDDIRADFLVSSSIDQSILFSLGGKSLISDTWFIWSFHPSAHHILFWWMYNRQGRGLRAHVNLFIHQSGSFANSSLSLSLSLSLSIVFFLSHTLYTFLI